MEVKGIVTKSIAEYVKANFAANYVEWENKLPSETLTILEKRIALHLWHSVKYGAEEPTRVLANMFFDGDVNKAAFVSGRYSAERSFNGVFRMLLVVLSPQLLVQKVGRLFGTFYKPSKTKATRIAGKHIHLFVYDMEFKSEIIEHRIAGWVQRAFELANGSEVEVKIVKSFARGDEFTEYNINWK